MKSNWTKGICMALVLGIMTSFVTGCESSDRRKNNSAEKISAEKKEGGGRFLESEIKLPDGADRILAMKKLTDGSIEIAAQNKETKELAVLKSKDGGRDWKTTKVNGVKREDIAQAAIAGDGKVFFKPWGTGKVKGKIAGRNGSVSDFSFDV